MDCYSIDWHQFVSNSSKLGEWVHHSVLAAVFGVESLHKTEICSGSSQSQDQIKSSQVSSQEPIYPHHKNDSLFVFSVRQSVVGRLAHLRHWDIPLLINRHPISLSLSPLPVCLSRSLFDCFMEHHVRFISKYTVAKCTVCLLVLRGDLLSVKKSYVH